MNSSLQFDNFKSLFVIFSHDPRTWPSAQSYRLSPCSAAAGDPWTSPRQRFSRALPAVDIPGLAYQKSA